MHLKSSTSNFLKHHSIPILLYRSIPVGCVAALLLLIGNLFCVFSGTPEVFADAPDIMPTSTAPVSLTLASNNPSVATTGSTTPGGVAYASSNVKYTATDIKSYSLKISLANGKSNPTNSGTTLTGTGTNKTVSTMGNNTWGYSWSDNINADETTVTYSTVPTYGSAAQVKSGTTDVDTTGKIMFAAKFADTAPTGHYTTSVLLSLTATPKVLTTYTVTYNCNSGTGCPTNLNTTSYNEAYAYTIPTTEPTRSGYKFLGYSTMDNSIVDANYAPGKTVTLSSAAPDRWLYAVWGLTINGITNMQQMTTEVCRNSTVGDYVTLKDTRDNSDYAVAKLADGNCWMAQNLRIMNKTITPNDSDVASNFTIPSSSTAFNSNTVAYAYYNNNQMYGALYNWCAATAGTCNSITDLANANYSICPKGWRLPGNEFYTNLINNYGHSSWTTVDVGGINYNGYYIGSPHIAFFPAAGSVAYNSYSKVGTDGYYWSSLSSSSVGAVMTHLQSTGINPTEVDNVFRFNGFSVRCVAR